MQTASLQRDFPPVLYFEPQDVKEALLAGNGF